MGKVGLAPVIGMMMAECAQVGLMFAGKAAMSDGMSNLVFVFYSNAFASLVLLPASLLFHRSQIPPLTLPILSAFFLLGFLGTSSQFFGYAGIYYSSPTLSTAMLNLVPGFTFILAIIFGMEKLDWKSSSSLAKSVGTIVLITGAFIMTYYKGPHLLMTSSPPNLSLQFFVPQTNWVIGGLLLAIDCVFTSAWLIVQASILKKFSAELIVVFFYCFFVAIQSAILCLVMERDLSSWSLKPGVRLAAVLYSAVFGSAFQVGVCTWCLHRTGPVFVAMFKPLGIVISAVVGTIFLGETVYLGRFIGAAVIVTGFYSVMWGKAKEGNSVRGQMEEEMVPFTLMVIMEGCTIGLTILTKTAMNGGMSPFVFIAYTNALGSILLLPCSFFFHHRGVAISQNLAFFGLYYSSPIVVCVMGLLIPAISFLLSIITRKAASDDKLEAKINPPLLIFYSTPDRWVLGSTLLAASSLSVCVWNIIQVGTIKQYPQVMKVLGWDYSVFNFLADYGEKHQCLEIKAKHGASPHYYNSK
ncbi:hypothetical protein CUMW_022040 [Citrus unshiu]|nr:hypothetical protein CUMW_022040 [Citrus unshiu]